MLSRLAAVSVKQNGEAIRAIRLAKGIGVRDMARRIDRDPGFYVHIEAGRRHASQETLTSIARELEVSLAAICGGTS
jgi:transcriptional regulator with XRE-family HTH domain